MNSEFIHPDKVITREGLKTSFLGSISDICRLNNNLFEVTINDNRLHIQIINDSYFRVKFFPGNSSLQTQSNFKNVIEDTEVNFSSDSYAYYIHLKKLKIELRKHPYQLSVFNDDDELISSDVLGSSFGWNENQETFASKIIQEDERFYGFGEKTGYLEKSGTTQTMWNSDVYAPHNEETNALYQSIPFFMSASVRGVYGLFLDNASKTEFDLSKGNELTFKTSARGVDYYFFYGSTMKEVLKEYTNLTGRMPLPPLWSLGYQQSRYSYKTEEEVMEIAKTFREKQIPCDVIYFDIHHMDEYRVFTWDKDNFFKADKLINDLADMGFHVVPIVDPGVKIDDDYPIYREGIEGDFFAKYSDNKPYTGPVWAGESMFPDFSHKDTRDWWGEKHKFFTDLGIKGIWNDMNEPSVFNDKKTMDDDVIHKNDGQPMTHKEFHNLYGYNMSKSTYEGMKKLLNGERPFVVTRAGYAGIQKYSAVWTGDNRSFWDHLAMSIPMFLNLGLSGVPFVGADVGGFAHTSNGELLARWTQLGAFTPFFRNHCVLEAPNQEPWVFGEKIEKNIKKYIELRYKLLPYFYNLIRESSLTGLPFLRPLVLEFPDDKNTYKISDQILVGESILIAPVYRPDTDYRIVYLPEGKWVDYWTGEVHIGKKHIMKHTPLNVMPIYIKLGSIIPMGAIKQHVYEKNEELTFHVYAGDIEGIKYIYFEDDGRTFDFEKGKYNELEINLVKEESEINLSLNYNHYGMKKDGYFRIDLPISKDVSNIEVSLGITYMVENKTISIIVPRNEQKGQWVNIKY